ncbi:MAG: ABC transporter substrate-binding protein [Candidatus Methylomirabilaceae bacterium]
MSPGDVTLIGALFPLSGRAAPLGRTGYQGARLAVEEVNEAGGVLGCPLELQVADTRGTMGTVAEARAFIEGGRATALLGVFSSAALLAVTGVARESRTVLMATIASTDQATGEKFHPYIFRSGVSNSQESRSAARVAAGLPHRRWYAIAPDYEYGYNAWTIFRTHLVRLRPDVEFVGEAWPEFLEHDYAAYVEAIGRARPEAVYNLLFGGDLVAFIRQVRGTGVLERFTFLNATGGDVGVLEEMGADMPEGLLCGARYYFQHPDTEANRRFVERYRARYGSWPTPWAEMSYDGVRFVAEGLRKAGTRVGDALVRALEGMTLELPRGTVTLRKEDHQAILDMVWGRTRRHADFAFPLLSDLQVFPGREITPTLEEVLAVRPQPA